jgi:hypothetical protein
MTNGNHIETSDVAEPARRDHREIPRLPNDAPAGDAMFRGHHAFSATGNGLSVKPDPALTLLAFAGASVLGLLPFTPVVSGSSKPVSRPR